MVKVFKPNPAIDLRKFIVLKTSDCHARDDEYYQQLNDDFELRNAGEHLYHYLMSIDISNYDPQRDFPQEYLRQRYL